MSIPLIRALPDLSALPEDLDLEVRAVLLVAAARRTTDETDRAALMERARRCDPLGRIVPRAE